MSRPHSALQGLMVRSCANAAGSSLRSGHSARWSRAVRNGQPVGEVCLSQDKETLVALDQKELEAAWLMFQLS